MTTTMADVATERPTSARLVGITKAFGGVRALDHVDFDARPGEIHALVRANGAGKSTLDRASPEPVPDEGEISSAAAGSSSTPGGCRRRRRRRRLPELALPSLSVGENVLGRNARLALISWGRIWRRPRASSRRRARRRPADAAAPVARRAATRRDRTGPLSGADVIVLDEPTSALSPRSATCFATLHRLKEERSLVRLVSHILEEVIGNADRVTVLRDGRRVTTTDARSTTKAELVDLMLGTEAQVLRATYEGNVVDLPPARRPPSCSRSEIWSGTRRCAE
jgi:ribose transport system ATP-binding protein